MRDYLTVRQAATQLKKHPGTIRRWIRIGKLPAKKMGESSGVYMILKSDLLEFQIKRKANKP